MTSVTAPDPDGSGPLAAPMTSYTYDNLGRTTETTDPLGHHTYYAYNSLNQTTSVTDALGKVTSDTYDAMGDVLTITAPDPDGSGPLTAPVTTYTYTNDYQLATTTDPLGNVTTDAYDHDGRLTSVTQPDPDGSGPLSAPVTSYTYTVNGQLATETDPLGNVTTYGYDNAGDLTSVTAPDPDGAGPLTSPVTGYTYDHDGREMTVTDPLSGATTYAYDADGNETSITDSDSNTTTFAYDHLNRLTITTDANSQTETDTYNADGEVTSQTDKDGRVTDYAYDHDGRLTREQWMSGGSAIYTANYSFDAAGNLTSASDNNSAYAYTYDSDNLPTQVDNSGTPTGPHVVLNIGYDSMERETSESATVAGTADFANAYAYDADSQMTQVKQQGQSGGNSVAAKLVNLVFDSDGRTTSISRYANLAGTQLVDTGIYGYDADSHQCASRADRFDQVDQARRSVSRSLNASGHLGSQL